MHKLNEKEAVHCRTQEQFDSVNESILKQFKYDKTLLSSTAFLDYTENTVLLNYFGYGYADVKFAKEKGYKILPYEEFMGEEIKPWKPKTGENVWMITANDYFIRIKLEIENIKYNDYKWEKDCFINGTIFRTRQLAREAKKAIEEALKKARKG